MKKLSLFLVLTAVSVFNLSAQLRVHNNGNIAIKSDSTTVNSSLVIGMEVLAQME